MKTKYELAEEIWKGIEPNKTEDNLNNKLAIILGLVFYKYLSDYFKQEYKNIYKRDFNESDINELDIDDIKDTIGYYIYKKNLFEEWSSKEKLKNITIRQLQDVFTDLINQIGEFSKEIFTPIIRYIKSNMENLSSKEIDKIIAYIDEVKKIEYSCLTKLDYHKYIFSYLLKNMTLVLGKKSDISFTPDDISSLISRLTSLNFSVVDSKEVNFYDPTCGSSSLLIHTINYLEKNKNIKLNKVYAQDINEFPSIISRMNFIIHGIDSTKIYIDNSDCLKKDWLEKENITDKEFDVITFNPSYSATCDPNHLKDDDRFSNYDTPSKTQTVFAFILHSLYYLKNNGSMICLMPHGVLFRGNKEGKIRKQLIEDKYIDAVIGLPANMSYGTNIATVILIFNKNRNRDNILFIDASKLYIKGEDKNTLGEGYISQICDLYKERKDVNGLSKVVSLDKIRDNNFNLNISLYIDNYKIDESNNLFCSVFGGIPNYEIQQLRDEYPLFIEIINSLFETPYDQNYYSNFRECFKFNIKDFDCVKQFINNHIESSIGIIKKIKENLSFEKISSSDYLIDFTNIFDNVKDIIVEKFANDKLVNSYHVIKIFFEHLIKLENAVTSFILDNEVLRKKYEKKKSIAFDALYRDLTEINPDLLISPIHLIKRYKVSDFEDIQKLYEERQSLSNEKAQYLEENYSLLENYYDDKGEIDLKKIKPELKNKYGISSNEYEVFSHVVELYNELDKKKKVIKTKAEKIYAQYCDLVERVEIEQLYDLMLDKQCEVFKVFLNAYLDDLIESFAQKIDKISKKYEITLFSLENEIVKNEDELLNKLKEIGDCFDEFDKKGLDEMINILGGQINE